MLKKFTTYPRWFYRATQRMLEKLPPGKCPDRMLSNFDVALSLAVRRKDLSAFHVWPIMANQLAHRKSPRFAYGTGVPLQACKRTRPGGLPRASSVKKGRATGKRPINPTRHER